MLLQNLASRRLLDKGSSLAELDSRLEVGRTTEKEARTERKRLAAELRQDLAAARLLLDHTFGKDSGHFRWREFSQLSPAELIPVARETAISLRTSPGLAAKAQASRTQYLDATGLAEVLEQGAQSLEDQIERMVAPQRQRETYDVGEKAQERAEAHSVRLRTQDLLFGLYRAAGKDHLAQRLRPKQRVKRAETTEGGGENTGTAMGMAKDPKGGSSEGTAADVRA